MPQLRDDGPKKEAAGGIVVGDEDLHVRPLVVTTCRAARTRVELGVEPFHELGGVIELRLSGTRLQAGADVGQTGGTHVGAGALERVRGAPEGVAVTLTEQAEDLRP